MQQNGYTIIENLQDIERICTGKGSRIRFVAVLQAIICTKNSLTFHLATFNDNDDTFIARINIKETFANRNATFAFALLQRALAFDTIHFPQDNLASEWKRRDIHIHELRLVVASATYVTNGSKSSLYLDDLTPLNLGAQATRAWGYMQSGHLSDDDWLTPNVTTLFKRLCKLDSEDQSLFQFKGLHNVEFKNNECLKNIILSYQSVNKRKQPVSMLSRILPIYKGIDTIDSQNEFDSQAMDTQQSPNVLAVPITTLPTPSQIPLYKSHPAPSPQTADFQAAEPLAEPPKKLDDLRPKAFAFMDLGSHTFASAKFVGSMKSGNRNNIYLISNENDPLENVIQENLLEPYINCVVVKPTNDTEDIAVQEIDEEIEASLDAVKSNMGPEINSAYTIVPQLISYKKSDKSIPVEKRFFFESPRETFKQWQDISITDKFPQFIKMVAVLVSYSCEHSSYYDFIFTDFTSNFTDHKYLFDKSFLSRDTTISFAQGFRTLMYHDRLKAFEYQLKRVTNKSIHELADSSIKDNLSHNGIVCELTVKVSVYQDKLNLILRECTPLTRSVIDSRAWYNDKTALSHLHSLYKRTFDFCTQNRMTLGLENKVYKNFARFFPIKRTDEIPGAVIIIPKDEIYSYDNFDDIFNINNNNNNTSVGTPNDKIYSYIPNLNIDIASFDITNETENFTSLYKTQTKMNHLFIVDNLRLLSWNLLKVENILILNVSNDLVSTGKIEQTRIMPLYIVDRSNLTYFCNGAFDFDKITTELNKLVGQKFSFKIKTGRLKLNEKYLLKIYCPIECTLAELVSQWDAYSFDKEIEDKYGSYDSAMVKIEQ